MAEFEQDPAADFLAREAEVLGGLEEDGLNSEELQQTNGIAAGAAETDQPSAAAIDAINGQFDQLDMNEQDPVPAEGMDGLNNGSIDYQAGGEPAATNGVVDGWAELSHADKQRSEPEKIKKWREEQKLRLEEKDLEDEKKKEEWKMAAKDELDQWYKKQADQLNKTKATNRETEQAFLEDRDKGISGKEWERISRLCDFNPKTAKHSKDISRMKSIILQLKAKPPSPASTPNSS